MGCLVWPTRSYLDDLTATPQRRVQGEMLRS